MKFKKLFLLTILVLLCSIPCYAQNMQICENFNYSITNMYIHAKRGKVISFVLPKEVEISPYIVVCALLTHLDMDKDVLPNRAILILSTKDLERFVILQYSRKGDWISISSGNFADGQDKTLATWMRFPHIFDRIEELVMGKTFPLEIKDKTKAIEVTVEKAKLLTLIQGKTVNNNRFLFPGINKDERINREKLIERYRRKRLY